MNLPIRLLAYYSVLIFVGVRGCGDGGWWTGK